MDTRHHRVVGIASDIYFRSGLHARLRRCRTADSQMAIMRRAERSWLKFSPNDAMRLELLDQLGMNGVERELSTLPRMSRSDRHHVDHIMGE